MLCFGFVSKTELITELCFGCHWTILAECQGFLFFPTHPQWVGCVLARNWKGTQTDQLTRTSHHTCHTLPYLACNKAEAAKQILFVCFSRVAVTERVAACGKSQFVCGRCWLIFFFLFPSFTNWGICLYLSPWVSRFYASYRLFHPTGEEGVSKQMCVWLASGQGQAITLLYL